MVGRSVAAMVGWRLSARHSEMGEVKRGRSVGVILETAWAADAGAMVGDGEPVAAPSVLVDVVSALPRSLDLVRLTERIAPT